MCIPAARVARRGLSFRFNRKLHSNNLTPIPPFATLEAEAEFWDTHNVTDYTRFDTGDLDEIAKEVLRLHGKPEPLKRDA
jgi:hypothetical protein